MCTFHYCPKAHHDFFSFLETDIAFSDIHPWELSINGEQWAGKIRFIGFIDVFFLIAYSANARFEHGIIVYSEYSLHPNIEP